MFIAFMVLEPLNLIYSMDTRHGDFYAPNPMNRQLPCGMPRYNNLLKSIAKRRTLRAITAPTREKQAKRNIKTIRFFNGFSIQRQ
jgi:hypothetical protein